MQTVYGARIPAGMPGLLADLRDQLVESFAAEGHVPFGRAVLAGTNKEKQVVLAEAGGATFRGVSVHTHAGATHEDGGYKDTETVNVLRRGMLWVEVTEAVEADDPAFYINAPGSGDEDTAGKFTDTDDGTSVAVPGGGVFRSSTTGAGLALLEFNLP